MSASEDIELTSIAEHVAQRRALTAPFPAEKEQVKIKTKHGDLTVTVQGDTSRPVLITYHDVGLNHQACFQGFFNYQPSHALADVMCILHIDAPGQEEGAEEFPATYEYPTFDELAEQIEDVLAHFGKRTYVALGAGAGGNIFLRHAIAHPNKCLGIFLIGSNAQRSGWIEWAYQKVALAQLSMSKQVTPFVQDLMLQTYFSPETLERNPDLIHAFREHLTSHINPRNLGLFLSAFASRSNVLTRLHKDLNFTVLQMIGAQSYIRSDVEDMIEHFNPARHSYIKVWGCGGLVHEERPDKVILPLLLFMQGLGLSVSTTASLNTLSQATVEATRKDPQALRTVDLD